MTLSFNQLYLFERCLLARKFSSALGALISATHHPAEFARLLAVARRDKHQRWRRSVEASLAAIAAPQVESVSGAPAIPQRIFVI
jgi:hypothetical protein